MPYLKVFDTNLFYQTYENYNTAPTIVFLHGLGSSHLQWRRQVAYFSQHYRVLVLDLRGFGQSSKVNHAFSMETLSEDVQELLRHLNLGPVIVVGLSLGGMLAFQLASKKPKDLIAICAVNAVPEFVSHGVKQKFEVLMRFFLVRCFSMKLLGNVIAKKLFPKPEQQVYRTEFLTNWQLNDKQSYLQAMKAILHFSVVDKLSTLAIPVLYIAGDRDYSSLAFKQSYVDKTPNARLQVIQDCGHAAPIEQAEVFNKLLHQFIISVQN